MLWNLDASWLMMAIATVAVLSVFLGSAIHSLTNEGFGTVGNALIICSGFFLAIFLANQQGYNLRELRMAVPVGLGGAFVCLFVLTFIKTFARL